MFKKVKILLEYILDFTNIYALYSLYAGLLIGLTLKLLLVWTLKNTNIDLITNKIEFSLTINDLQIQKKSRTIPNQLLVWIIKFVRNKTGTNDETDTNLVFLHI